MNTPKIGRPLVDEMTVNETAVKLPPALPGVFMLKVNGQPFKISASESMKRLARQIVHYPSLELRTALDDGVLEFEVLATQSVFNKPDLRVLAAALRIKHDV